MKIIILLLAGVVFFTVHTGTVNAMGTNATYDLQHFWFRDDDGNESGASGYGTGDLAVNASITSDFPIGTAFRLRMGILKNNNSDLLLTVTPKLQYKLGGTTGSCTTNTWTDVPTETSCGSSPFCQASSGNFTDGTATTRQLDASNTFATGGDMIETNGTPNQATYGSGNTQDRAEWEWMLDSDNAAESGVYTFRVVHSSGTALDSYSNCPTITVDSSAVTSYTQNNYLWYVDPSPESENVTDPWSSISGVDLAENAEITVVPANYDPPSPTQELRLRMNITVNGLAISANTKYFKLQFRAGTDSDCSTGSWTDVGPSATWEYAASTVTDDTTLTVAKLTGTDRLETYSKVKPANTPTATSALGEGIEFDFHIVGTNSASASRYLFRAVESTSDGSGTTALNSYTSGKCPALTTEPGTANILRHGQVFTEGSKKGFFWAN